MLSDFNVRRNLDNGTMRELNGNFGESLQSELELMLQQQHNYDIIDKQREINIYRSGSAPPTVEGSLSAVGSLLRNPNLLLDNFSNNADVLLSEEEIRSHPAYLSYYYSHENLNPRLPPPLLSREDWRVAQKFQARGLSFGGVADWTKEKTVGVDGSSSLFSMQPSSFVKEAEDKLMEISEVNRRNLSRASSTEWLDRGSDGLIGLSNARLGIRKKSFADILQEGLDQPASLSGHLSRPASSSSFSDVVEKTGISSHHAAELYNGGECTEALHRRGINPSMPRVQSFSAAVSHSSVSEMAAALSRSKTPEPQQIGRSQSPRIPLMSNRVGLVEKKNISSSNTLDGLSIITKELPDIAAAISSLSLSNNQVSHEDSFVQPQHKVGFDHSKSPLNMSNIDRSTAAKFTIPNSCVSIMGTNAIVREQNASKLGIDDLYSNNTFGSTNSEGSNISYQNDTFSTMGSLVEMPSGCSVDKNLKFSNHLDAGSNLIGRRNGLLSSNHQVWSDHHLPDVDACYIQYMQKASDYAIASSDDPSRGRSHLGTSHPDERLQNLQEAYVETLLTHQKNEYDTFLHKSNGLHHGYYLNSHFGLSIPYEGKATAKSVHPSGRSRGPIRKNGRNLRFNIMSRTSVAGSSGSLHSDAGTKMEDVLASSLLAELKSNKTRSLELVDVVDNVVEFSMDQYGSRFIQQKLETATVEEKTKIFPEIISYARALMTDVFGNYVIQKFFEHGTESQRKDLARQLIGHVLPLSLQMYGCRVIQKALEVVDVEHQTLLVAELDGSVMKCVRDQNGNHVIQKCIECIPQDRIQFIISSFFGQVVALSTHPYGCRVIQRVLERCDVPKTQVIMDEIIHSACILAQDQYGNYVIQHVLQHGKLHERSAIISNLAGQIVKMSQQKFASNVVEKCLTFGGPEERQLLVNEMLGSTDENEPLQTMMKDPFGNYVVQKVLETCDYESCELILSRIKVHLSALKRYTYSKHIVSRVEKLITTGDRRSGFPLPYCT